MARFFRHLFCNCDVQTLTDQVGILQSKVTTLQRRVDDAEDYIEKMSGRLLKRLERSKPPEPEPDHGGLDPISAAIHARRHRAMNGGR